MVRPFSLELRERVVAAVAGDRSCRSVAEAFGVSVASVVTRSQRFRATGSAAARPMGGKRPVLLAGQRAFILDRIATDPDLSLPAVAAELAERGVVVSYDAVWTPRAWRRQRVRRLFKMRLSRFQQDAAMILTQGRREVLPNFVQRLFECLRRELSFAKS
jgi:transposase